MSDVAEPEKSSGGPASNGPDGETEPIAFEIDAGEAGPSRGDDPDRYARTWFWLILAAGFGLFLVFGSVQAHYWLGNRKVRRSTGVLDIWRAQVNGLPDVAHQSILKAVFLASVFGFIGLAVIALWLAVVEVRADLPGERSDPDRGDAPASASGHAAG